MKLPDPKMESFQGPAFWAYNNAVFTDEDFANIEKLSGATKETETTKIGRFGLGFNAIYKITDVPSFISREYIAIFDPHMTHVGSHITNAMKPGIRLNMHRHKHIQKLSLWKDQFKPFNGIFGCDVSPYAMFSGTLFRFPLRTESQAKKSLISKEHYTQDRTVRLFRRLHDSLPYLLLFTQNILEVSVHHLAENAPDPSHIELLFSVSKQPRNIIRSLNPTPTLPAMNCNPDDRDFLRQTNILRAASHQMSKRRPAVLEASALLDVKVIVTKQATSLLRVAKVSESYMWLVSNSSGGKEAFEMARDNHSLLPIGGAAIQVFQSCSYIKAMPRESYVFCFLPLPIKCPGIPVHINGYFAVTSSRRALCSTNSDDISDKKGDWNKALATDSICRAYMNLLEDLATKSYPKQFNLSCMLPIINDYQDQVSQTLSRALYKEITESDAKIFTDGTNYGAFREIQFLSPLLRNSEVGKLALAILRSYSCKVVVDLPGQFMESFKQAGCENEMKRRMVKTKKFFEQYVLPNIQNMSVESRGRLISFALKRETLDDLLKQRACIPASPYATSLVKASSLVDPTSSISDLYSNYDGRFPMLEANKITKNYTLLQGLKRLGMKDCNISWGEILDCCMSVKDLTEHQAHSRAKSLVKHMDEKLRKEGDQCPYSIQQKIITTIFLPVLQKPKGFPFTWNDSQNVIMAPPRDVYLKRDMTLICCIEPIADDSLVSSHWCRETASFLGLSNKNISATQLVNQLKMLKLSIEKGICSSGKETEYIRDVYSAMQEKCHNRSDASTFKQTFKEQELLYVNGTFSKPEYYAFRCHGSCAPFLHQVPQELLEYRQLLSTVAVKDQFENKDYISALKVLKMRFDNTPLPNTPLPYLQVAVDVLNSLVRCIEESGIPITEQDRDNLFVPDSAGVLQKNSEMCYNNCPWMKQSGRMKLTHSRVSHNTAATIQIKTIREDVLGRNSCPLGSVFGQREKLSNRIRRILSGYPKDGTILKEMLQNADDAGATKMDIILDHRNHPTGKIFEESWKPLQGPALCIYHNKPFTETDLRGIQNLGEGSKGNDPYKTGQFGIGFNSVYHLTDTPMFLTGNGNLCIFDPNCQYVPGATVESPGRQYQNISELKSQFPDVFHCLLEQTGLFNLNNGTLFRFPLRTQDMEENAKSHIASHVTVSEVQSLLEKFCSELPSCLLFLSYLREVRILEISRNGKVYERYSVTATMSKEENVLHQKFISKLREVNWLGKESRHVTYSLHIKDSKGAA